MTKDDRIIQYDALMKKYYYMSVRELDEIGFFTAPASVRYHGAYSGGLFDHSFAVAKYLVEMTEKLGLNWQNQRSPYLVGMFHDLCKCDNYVQGEDLEYDYNPNMIIPDHGAKSVIMLQRWIVLTDEEIACIRWHMGAYEKDPHMWNYYNRAVEKFPNVLYTHTADMLASKVLGV
jgi:hypothetical protein